MGRSENEGIKSTFGQLGDISTIHTLNEAIFRAWQNHVHTIVVMVQMFKITLTFNGLLTINKDFMSNFLKSAFL